MHETPVPRRAACRTLAAVVLTPFSNVIAWAEESRGAFVEGYTGQVSYAPGEELTLHLSTNT